MCCNNEASVVLSGSGEAQLGPEIVLSASTPPGGLALEWQRAVARSGNIIAGLRSALTWTCSLVFFSRVCGVGAAVWRSMWCAAAACRRRSMLCPPGAWSLPQSGT